MRKIKMLIAALVCICMCFNCIGAIADEMSTYNIAITSHGCTFSIDSNGVASCHSDTSVKFGYTVQLVMQLQQKSPGMWRTVQSWNETGDSFVALDQTHQVEKGYSYRLMAVYIAYDADGNQVESFYDLSQAVEY